MRTKPLILLNWSYKRMDLLLPFFALKNDFEFIFLFHRGVDDVLIRDSFQSVSWEEFSSPYQILDRFQPDRIIFHDIESFYQFSLNLAAHNRNIKTIVLEHGFKTARAIPEIMEHDKKQLYSGSLPDHSGRSSSELPRATSTASFYFKSLRIKNLLSLPLMLRFAFIRKRNPLTYALVHFKHAIRHAGLYVNFTRDNASYIRERDGVPEEKFIYIGNPFLDYFFHESNSFNLNEKYYLLIDSPLTEVDWYNISREVKRAFLEKLNNYCLGRGCRLVIKLHPLSYTSEVILEHENIIYIREKYSSAMIRESQGCFAFTSTLLLLAAIYRPCILFQVKNNSIEREFLETKCFIGLDFFDFSESDIQFSGQVSEEATSRLIEKYFYRTDGRATERLKEILLR